MRADSGSSGLLLQTAYSIVLLANASSSSSSTGAAAPDSPSQTPAEIAFYSLWALICTGTVVAGIFFALVAYTRPGADWLSVGVTALAWFLVFSVCYILPIDLDEEANRQDLITVWRIVYWLSFLLTWLVIPLLTDYHKVGAFTFKRKLRHAAHAQLRFYAIAGVISLFLLIFLGAKSKLAISELLGGVLCFANLFGLGLVWLFLGYGLVEIPRAMWAFGKFGGRLQASLVGLSHTRHEFSNAKDRLYQTARLLEQLQARLGGEHALRAEFELVRAELPREADYDMSEVTGQNLDPLPIARTLQEAPEITLPLMEQLNVHVKGVRRDLQIADGLFENAFRQARSLDKIVNLVTDNSVGQLRLKWRRFKINTAPALLRVLAVVFGILSALVVWCEAVLLFPRTHMSPLGLMMDKVRPTNPFLLQLVGVGLLAYQMCCCFCAVFVLHIPGFYYMAPRRKTDGSSLLFNAMTLSRITFPLAYNFLMMLRLHDTSFEEFMGPMRVIAWLGDEATAYFSVTVLIVSLLTLVDAHTWVLKKLGVSDHDSNALINRASRGELTENEEIEVRDGRLQLAREQRKRQEAAGSQELGEAGSAAGAGASRHHGGRGGGGGGRRRPDAAVPTTDGDDSGDRKAEEEPPVR